LTERPAAPARGR